MKIAFAFVTLLLVAQGFSQKNLDPTPDDIILAQKLRTQYAKDDIVLLFSEEKVSFETDKKTALVHVNQLVNEKLMNIGHRADISKYEAYNNESEIKTFSLKYRNGKSPYAY